MEFSDEKLNTSIYKVSRSIKRKDNSLYNALRSIYEDSIFVGEISQLWPELPLLANLRCGLWYAPKFDSNCYFKSTDGHTNNLSFNISRLNLHVALIAGQKGGCMIVDSTRKGKKFPDSMSKTIPIWTCIMNRVILNYWKRLDSINNIAEQDYSHWDCSLHLPLWVSKTEKEMIENRLQGWTDELEASGADISSVATSLKKPLRPLWISQKTVIWLNEVPDFDSWNFTPVMLVSASSSSGNFHNHTTSDFSWHYIAGAGDDEESWSRGLYSDLFWKHAYDIIKSDPSLCNQKVATIVENDRVRRSHRGENAPQMSSKLRSKNMSILESLTVLDVKTITESKKAYDEGSITWLGSTNIAVCSNQFATDFSRVDCILHCDREPFVSHPELYLHLPIVDSKFDRFSLLRYLPSALDFAKMQLGKGKALLVCCENGKNISICICLAILTSLFNVDGQFDYGQTLKETLITKFELRKRLIFICRFVIDAQPSRGNLRQVFNWLHGIKI